MNNGIKKLGKGFIAIFAFKVSLLLIALVLHACQVENDFDNDGLKESKRNFLAAIQDSRHALNKITIQRSKSYNGLKGSNLMKENTDAITTFTMCLLPEQNDSINTFDYTRVDTTSVDTIDEVVDLGNSLDTKPVIVNDSTNVGSDDSVPFDFSLCFDIPQNPTIDALQPVIVESKNYLYQFGFTEQEIQDMILSENGSEEDLIPLVMTMVNVEEHDDVAFNYMSAFFPSANAQSLTDIGQCAIYAIGADVIWSLGSDASKWTKKAIKKAFKAIAQRFLGPIGVAIAVVSFGLCVAEAALTDV